MALQAVIIKDPYSHGYADGGGTIVQRFGAPANWVGTDTKYHSFGQYCLCLYIAVVCAALGY